MIHYTSESMPLTWASNKLLTITSPFCLGALTKNSFPFLPVCCCYTLGKALVTLASLHRFSNPKRPFRKQSKPFMVWLVWSISLCSFVLRSSLFFRCCPIRDSFSPQSYILLICLADFTDANLTFSLQSFIYSNSISLQVNNKSFKCPVQSIWALPLLSFLDPKHIFDGSVDAKSIKKNSYCISLGDIYLHHSSQAN